LYEGVENPEACGRTRGMRALLWVLAAATVVSAPVAGYARFVPAAFGPLAVAAVSAALVAAGGWLGQRRGAPRLLGTAAFLAWVAGTVVQQVEHPGRCLLVLLGAVGVLGYLWPSERLRRHTESIAPARPEHEVPLVAFTAVAFGLDLWQSPTPSPLLRALALAAMYGVPIALTVRRAGTLGRLERGLLVAACLFAVLPIAVALLSPSGSDRPWERLGLLSPLAVLVLVGNRALDRRLGVQVRGGDPSLFDAAMLHPSRVLVVSFLAICALGTLPLGLPVASADGTPLTWLDAAFTAVSATCVTGLIVVDTPTALSGFGQLVVLGLIQVGGLGIMVFSAAAVVLLGRRLSLSHERVAADLVGASSRADLWRAVRMVLAVTFVTEAIGALVLSVAFLGEGDPIGLALWRGLFTAVSAFCNAGFALQTDSLVPYAENGVIMMTVAAIIIVGGLGPAVIVTAGAWRRSARRTLHARLVLWVTATLLVVPTVAIAVLEWRGTLAGLGFFDKVSNAFFQAVTLRTAGFNSIDLTAVHPVTWTLMVMLMFVGGSPGSTAGGAKTTTIAVVLLAIGAVVRGRERVELFGRTLPVETILRATAVTTLGVLSCCAALAAIQLTQSMPLELALFEVVSALATVGLSIGGTAALDEVGKLIIIACMFAGRVGPLTLFVFLVARAERRARYRYPEEHVLVG
jgi:trk system potassium uptake protein TrkH